jgi:hypothetical protein
MDPDKSFFHAKKKSIIFWDFVRCSSLEARKHFGGSYHLYLQGRRLNQESNNQKEKKNKRNVLLVSWLLYLFSNLKM